jgi:ATP-dependent exoDNAse (exonuclease V) beta subunit
MDHFSGSTDNLETIFTIIEQSRASSDQFAETLRHNQVPHLSFSQITTVESCQYRYFLQYVRLVEPVPTPDYFTKGKFLHQVIAASYEKAALGQPVCVDDYLPLIDRQFQGDAQRHLHNAFLLHLENRWKDCQVLAIEKPFAMLIDPELPACVGVIDLILQKSGRFILVDHKTGRNFTPQDPLQMAIYVEYIQREYGGVACEFYYDHYRWVNNLDRIRKPAFQRDGVPVLASDWPSALARIRSGYETIRKIKAGRPALRNGQCFRCPYRKNC